MKVHPFKKFPVWLIGALLYGISWPLPWDVNLSFLAWFALVFLFVSLEKTIGFLRYFMTVWGFSFITHAICSGWFLDIPTNKLLIVIGAVTETLSFTVPFIAYYIIKKKAGFNESVFILPFLLVAGEWLYCLLEHNLGSLLISHTQTANLWLIQYADIFGFLAVTFWVVLFNVIIYSAWVGSKLKLPAASGGESSICKEKDIGMRSLTPRQAAGNALAIRFRPFSVVFLKKAAPIALIMIALPLGYAAFRRHQIGRGKSDALSIAMINTKFAPTLKTFEQLEGKLDRIVELTDSVDYYSKINKIRHDLYVWHEGAIASGNRKEFVDFVQGAVNDWQTPLLSGMKVFEKFEATDKEQPVNRVVLFTPDADSSGSREFYEKMHLAPGWEGIPYLSMFHKAGIRFGAEYKYHRPGDQIRLFDIRSRNRHFKIGTPLCFEVYEPSLWNRMVRLGADCFIQVTFESWFGKTYFQKQIAYVTRLRAIETRRSVARCSNGGLTFFVDSFGRIYAQAPDRESSTSDFLASSNTITFYTRHPNLFNWICLAVSGGYFLWVTGLRNFCLSVTRRNRVKR